MFYEITNTIGASVTIGDNELIVGNTYDKKTKAGKNGDGVLAFSKSTSDEARQWRFDGWATVDYDTFTDEMTTAELEPLAYRSAIIDLQRDIRPGKSSKRAERQAAFVELKRQLDDGEIDQAAFMAQLPNFIG